MTTETIRASIRRALVATGRSSFEVSQAIGRNRTYIDDFLKNRKRTIKTEDAAAIAEELGLPVALLMPVGREPDLAPDERAAPPGDEMPRDLPVYGTAQGGAAGRFALDSGNPIDWFRRPPGLARNREAYALFVEGDSMMPAHPHGALRFIRPRPSPRVGEDCIVQTGAINNTVEAMIAEVGPIEGDYRIFRKLNPPGSTVRVPVAAIKAMHKVLSMNELFGV